MVTVTMTPITIHTCKTTTIHKSSKSIGDVKNIIIFLTKNILWLLKNIDIATECSLV